MRAGAPVAAPGADATGDPWSRVRAEASTQRALWGIVGQMTLESIEGGRVTLLCPPDLASMASKIAVPKLTELFGKHGVPGATIALKAMVVGEGAAKASEPVVPSAPAAARAAPQTETAEPAGPALPQGENPADHPLVKRVQQVLGARVTRVARREPPQK